MSNVLDALIRQSRLSESYPEPSGGEIATLSELARIARAKPGAWRKGRAWLEAHGIGSGKQVTASVDRADSVRRALLDCERLELDLSSSEAEAVCLLLFGLYDDNPASHPALPRKLDAFRQEGEQWAAVRKQMLRHAIHRLRPQMASALARCGTTEMMKSWAIHASTEEDIQPIPALSDSERAVLDLLLAQPAGKGLTGKEIVRNLARRYPGLSQSGLTTRIIPKLRKFCPVPVTKGVGYSIPENHRARIRKGLAAGGQPRATTG